MYRQNMGIFFPLIPTPECLIDMYKLSVFMELEGYYQSFIKNIVTNYPKSSSLIKKNQNRQNIHKINTTL